MTPEEKNRVRDRYLSQEVRDLFDVYFSEYQSVDRSAMTHEECEAKLVRALEKSGFTQFVRDTKDTDPVLLYMVLNRANPSFNIAYIKRVILSPRFEEMGFDFDYIYGDTSDGRYAP